VCQHIQCPQILEVALCARPVRNNIGRGKENVARLGHAIVQIQDTLPARGLIAVNELGCFTNSGSKDKMAQKQICCARINGAFI
jgi:hypothetical protein